jgi:hypothetical protein
MDELKCLPGKLSILLTTLGRVSVEKDDSGIQQLAALLLSLAWPNKHVPSLSTDPRQA